MGDSHSIVLYPNMQKWLSSYQGQGWITLLYSSYPLLTLRAIEEYLDLNSTFAFIGEREIHKPGWVQILWRGGWSKYNISANLNLPEEEEGSKALCEGTRGSLGLWLSNVDMKIMAADQLTQSLRIKP